MDRIRRAFGSEPEPEPIVEEDRTGIMNDLADVTTLGWETRIQAFGFLFLLGIVVSLIGSLMLYIANFNGFAILVSLGSLISMGSTIFLMGPVKQIKKMFEHQRIFATLIYFLAIAMTFVAGIVWKSSMLAMIFVVLQYVAMAYYSISYIPYAREWVNSCCCKCI